MPHGNERCEFCNMREIDGHRWDCPLSDEDVEEWAEDPWERDEEDEEDDDA